MAEKDLRLAVLSQARKFLGRAILPDDEKAQLQKLLNVLILALEKHVSPENLEDEACILSEKLVSSHALLALAQQQADELEALKVLSLNLTSSLDLPTVLNAVVRESMRLIENTRIVHIFLYTNKKLEFGASLDANGQRNRIFSEPRKNGITATVAKQGKMIVVEDIKKHPLYNKTSSDWSGSIVGIPLIVGKKVVGVMNLSRRIVGPFSPVDLRFLKMLADQAAVAISNASLHQTVSKKAYTDTITGLANRRALDERLEYEIVNSRHKNSPFAVVMMDLDGFKAVNDTYGHETGDLVLRAIFNVIAIGIRSSDFIARYGGDELTLILSQSNMESTRKVTDKILENLANFAYRTDNGELIKLGISGGISIYPKHGLSGPELLRAADAALYTAKKYHRGTFVPAKAATGPLSSIDF